MRRAVVVMVVLISSAVCAAGTVLLVRSFAWREYYGISFIDQKPDQYLLRHLFVHSDRGWLTWSFRRQYGANRQEADDLRDMVRQYNEGRPPDRIWWERWPASQSSPVNFDPRTLGFAWRTIDTNMFMMPGQTGPVDEMSSLSFPHVYLIVAGAALPLLALWRWRRLRQRVRHGLCRGCGYDLRASTGRCPECGREINPADGAIVPSAP